MPVEKVVFRLKPVNITRASEATFQTSHEARVDRPLSDIDLNEFFNDVQANLQVGDQVTICAYEGGMIDESRKLREIGWCRIIGKGILTVGARATVRAVWVGDQVKIPDNAHLEAPKKDKTVRLEVKGTFRNQGYTVNNADTGQIVEHFKTKEEAEAFRDKFGEKPEPKGKAA
jgi:hypothetical protein